MIDRITVHSIRHRSPSNEGALPFAIFVKGGCALLFSLALIHPNQSFSGFIERPTAPRPRPWMRHQSALHRIRVHVVQLFPQLFLAVNIEVVIPPLPEPVVSGTVRVARLMVGNKPPDGALPPVNPRPSYLPAPAITTACSIIDPFRLAPPANFSNTIVE
jgi:hypothetical protein